jgi:sialidase-1
LIAVFDVRHKNSSDLPGNIDVGMMRSADNGSTWSKMQIILDFDKEEEGAHGNGVGDPTVLVDQKTGHILVAALWSKGNRAWNGSGPGLTPEETGQLVLTRSTDDGRTWSPPLNITQQIAGRNPQWRLCFNGARGMGFNCVAERSSSRRSSAMPRGRLILVSSSASMTADAWTISPPAIPAQPPTSEAQIAELTDGSLLLSMRDESRQRQTSLGQVCLAGRFVQRNVGRAMVHGDRPDLYGKSRQPPERVSALLEPQLRAATCSPDHPHQRR